MFHALAYLSALIGFCVSCYTWITTDDFEKNISAKVVSVFCLLILHDQKEAVLNLRKEKE